MAWIDYKKAYDMAPHWCIIECLDCEHSWYRVARWYQVIKLLQEGGVECFEGIY